MKVSSISEAMQPTFRGRLKRACNQISYLETPAQKVGLKNLYLICDYYGGSHEADECKQNDPSEQVCLSGGDIYDDPSILRFYQNDDTPPRGNNKCKEKGEDGLEWTIRSRFEDELANFMLEKKSCTKGIGEILDQHRKELHEQFSQILSTIRKSKTPKPEAPTFGITTRSGVNTQEPSFPAPSQSTSTNHTEGVTEKEGPEDVEPSIMQELAPCVRNNKTINVNDNEILNREIQHHMSYWVEIICENIFCLGGHRDHVPTCLCHMLYCIETYTKYNLSFFILKLMESIQNTPKAILPYGMILTRLFTHNVSNLPESSNDRYILCDCVMHPLAPHYEQTTRSNHGTKRCRSSNPSSSSNVLDHPSSSHHIDENNDGNDGEYFHSNTPFPTQLVNSLSNIVPRVFENPPYENQTLHSY
ncbi:hypothetical protein Tco_0990229 [Tanacetum coccineum]|uniref:Uncharacterized protein n=1 Tax=Tanacetum coccineum TaxID=301880 RepID=A0ABQ5EW62_9ASTR